MPLSKVPENSLVEEQNPQFGQYALPAHPNYHKNNVYQGHALSFIRAYLRHLEQELSPESAHSPPNSLTSLDLILEELPFIDKLNVVLDSYAPLSTEHIKILLHACLGRINKLSFIRGLSHIIQEYKSSRKESGSEASLAL